LNHLVKERYPRFIDALRDLDDTLSMIHLFAALPSVGRITPEKTARCKELVRHWQYYIARSKSLTKVFVSVKGVYFQSEIMGEPITWLQPHAFTQTIPSNIDFRVMITFLDFYEVFLKFVMYKLFGTLELSYPPVVDKKLDASGCFLLAVKADSTSEDASDDKDNAVTEEPATSAVTVTSSKPVKGLKKSKASKMESKIAAINQDGEDIDNIISEFKEEDDDDDGVDISQPLADVFAELHGENYNSKNPLDLDKADQATFNPASMTTDQEGTEKAQNSRRTLKDEQSKLFQNLCFFVNRETPLEWLQLCVISFGGNIGWDGPDSPYKQDDPRITHQVVDRPTQDSHGANQREYIQPQWVFDSINAMVCLPIHKYRPGSVLPPHLSPFVDDSQEGYVPQYRKEVDKLVSTVAVQKGLADAAEKAAAVDESGDDEEEGSESDDDEYEKDLEAERKGVSYSTKRSREEEEDSDEEDDSGSDEEEGDDDEEEEEEEEEVALNSKKQKGVVYAPKKGSEGEVRNITYHDF
jgi:pescadillo protein